ncbi:HAD family hydrolase [Haloarcula laminariae]|uniref:HAD family hydrolase n=1 Tax=Haloarcula laminariae TaxID=2961577 RepID=UPI0024061E8B|nr:HAD-IA family hydrolase [Halomicroarcula sp. FL173]
MSESDYDAIVFDNDGVIVEPTDRAVLVDAVVESLEAFDLDVGRAFAERTVANDAVPAETVREHGVAPEPFWHHRELTASLAQQSHVRDGGKPVYDDVVALGDLDVPLALVSNNQHATVEFLLAYHDLGDLFVSARGRAPTLAGAAKRKPEPHLIERALDAVGTGDALYVGDSEKDIVAARRAGIDSAFLRRSHVDHVELSAEPTFEAADLHELFDRIPNGR